MKPHHFTNKKVLTYFANLVREEKSAVRTLLILTILFNIFLFMIPIAIQVIINQILIQVFQQTTIFLFAVILILIFCVYSIKIMQLNLVEKLQRRVFLKASDYYARFFSQWSSKDFEKIKPQTSLHHFFEVFSLQKSFVKSIVEGFQFSLQTLIGLLIISLYHPIFLLYAVLLSLSIYLVINFYGRRAISLGIKHSSSKYDTLSWMEQLSFNRELFRNITGSTFGQMQLYEKLHLQMGRQETYFKTYLKQVQTLLFIQGISSIGLLGIGGYLVFKQQLGLGQLIAAEIIITSILIGFNKLPQLLDYWYDAIISAKKLYDTHEADFLVAEGTEQLGANSEHHWQVNHISFTKKNALEPIFSDLHYSARPGELVALYAKEGKGKSLLVNIMMKYQDADQGTVTLNHHPISSYQNKSFYEQVQLVKSDPQFFIGSILENITFNQLNHLQDQEKIVSLLNHLGLWTTINQFPEQLHQKIFMSGSPFSETQAKLFSLARAIYQSPPTLMIDSFFDALDSASINRSFELLLQQKKMTTFITTSNESIAQRCSKIISLETGKTIK